MVELFISKNPTLWEDIIDLLNSHFGDSRNLSSLIQVLQRMRQLRNELCFTFCARLQTHHAKILFATNKQNITVKETQAQSGLIESIAFNSLLTSLDRKIVQIVHASDPIDILTVVSRVKRQLQLCQLETQFSNNRNPTPVVRNQFAATKQYSFCK